MRTIRSKSGELCFKRAAIKVFAPGNTKCKTILQCAPGGKVFTQEGIDQVLEHIAGRIESVYPSEEYRLVPTGPGAFNFVHVGPRLAEPEEEITKALETATIDA